MKPVWIYKWQGMSREHRGDADKVVQRDLSMETQYTADAVILSQKTIRLKELNGRAASVEEMDGTLL